MPPCSGVAEPLAPAPDWQSRTVPGAYYHIYVIVEVMFLLYFGNFLMKAIPRRVQKQGFCCMKWGFVRLRCRSYLAKGSFRSNGVT